jgi:hypothetical protein
MRIVGYLFYHMLASPINKMKNANFLPSQSGLNGDAVGDLLLSCDTL